MDKSILWVCENDNECMTNHLCELRKLNQMKKMILAVMTAIKETAI